MLTAIVIAVEVLSPDHDPVWWHYLAAFWADCVFLGLLRGR